MLILHHARAHFALPMYSVTQPVYYYTHERIRDGYDRGASLLIALCKCTHSRG